MITQKGLKDEDIVVIMNADKTETTFNVSFPDCEKFAEFKRYASAEECNAKFQEDFQAYKNRLASTIFTVSMDEDDEQSNAVAVNDSWGSIFNDALSSVKTKLFR